MVVLLLLLLSAQWCFSFISYILWQYFFSDFYPLTFFERKRVLIAIIITKTVGNPVLYETCGLGCKGILIVSTYKYEIMFYFWDQSHPITKKSGNEEKNTFFWTSLNKNRNPDIYTAYKCGAFNAGLLITSWTNDLIKKYIVVLKLL